MFNQPFVNCIIQRFALILTGWACVLLYAVSASGAPQLSVQQHSPGPVEETLRGQPVADLVDRVMTQGSAASGALVYYNPVMTCVRCHEPATNGQRLGPVTDEVNRDASVQQLIESLLEPSKQITEGFETETIVTRFGIQFTGLVVEEDESEDGYVLLADPELDGTQTRIAQRDIEDRKTNKVSAMPLGLVEALPGEQAFLDLVRYLVEIKRGGKQAVLRLRPPDSFFVLEPLPEYEASVDHAGLIASLDRESLEQGQAIYRRFCASCHGIGDQEGTIPAARRFVDAALKNGNDPHSMYQTLTHGYGLMVPQRWMVPRQKYDVIHYIREQLIKPANPDQYFELNDDYLANLPTGTTSGPDPVESTPWSDMDYGNTLINTYEVGRDGENIAYKGIAVRLDDGPGGVSQGRHWMLYEHDTMRVAAAWSGSGFIDYRGIHFNDEHNIHPRIVGDVHFTNNHLPGWANPQTGTFEEDPRVVGRDQKRYGPLPESWLKYRGLFHHGDRTILQYTVGETEVLEMPGLDFEDGQPVFVRNLEIGPRPKPLLMRVAATQDLQVAEQGTPDNAILLQREQSDNQSDPAFDGAHFLTAAETIDWTRDLTIAARFKTTEGGTLICQTTNSDTWVPGGKSLFVRGGRLVFDIGWVGAVTSEQAVDDGQWHTVAMTWEPDEERVTLFIDGQRDEVDELAMGEMIDDPVLRIGYTADDFPGPRSVFLGDLTHLVVWNGALEDESIEKLQLDEPPFAEKLLANWNFTGQPAESGLIVDAAANNKLAWQKKAGDDGATLPACLWALVHGPDELRWNRIDDSLCLEIPAGQQTLAFSVSLGSADSAESGRATLAKLGEQQSGQSTANLRFLTTGGLPRFPDQLVSTITTLPHDDTDPFAVDYLNHPEDNLWNCRMRFTGIDFLQDDVAVLSAWDGSIWQVSGFLASEELTWRRIASGLFQPLGIRVIDGRIFVTCRDQIVVLEDQNGDGETDWYRCFNSDHQVTEHFHEFAMGLQTDSDGNLYYAKSARHAKPALVPHHGTLLQVSPDGAATVIVANGFRAANGVCVNPDGSFYVTDQEGHWNPKNRINWVRPGGFYGNMMGYHDVTDDSDQAMEQPLCWITNAFDRSPGELMWVPDDAWGPLGGSLLNLSYGMGQVFVVPHELVRLDGEDQLQGGMCALPIPLFPTGVMRGTFHARDGHLYCCGMYAWAGNQQHPGGFYRIRHTGQPVHLPLGLRVSTNQIAIEFSGELDVEATRDLDRFSVSAWDIRRTANYGSPHFNERQLEITAVELQKNRRTVLLTIPGLLPVRCVEIKCLLKTADGLERPITIHNTIHAVAD